MWQWAWKPWGQLWRVGGPRQCLHKAVPRPQGRERRLRFGGYCNPRDLTLDGCAQNRCWVPTHILRQT